VKKEMNCNYVCKDETEEEIMKTAAEEHAIRDHGYKVDDLMTPELRSKIRSHIEILILLLSSYF
jgi:predicted small metal-binding protein